jgi:hypothetical protein
MLPAECFDRRLVAEAGIQPGGFHGPPLEGKVAETVLSEFITSKRLVVEGIEADAPG